VIIPTIPTPLVDGIYFAIRLDYEFTCEFTLVVGVLGDVYWPPDRQVRRCHPLESVLLGREAAGEKRNQMAMLIGVSLDWLDGFCDSLRGCDSGADGSYRDGFCLARWPELKKWVEPLETSCL
jgi:hypothetical protein